MTANLEVADVDKLGRKRTGRPPKPMMHGVEAISLVENLRLLGATVDQIARVFKVDDNTVYRWVRVSPAFRDAWARGGLIADALVARGLYKLATGYSVARQKVVWNPAAKEAQIVDYVEHVGPDERAAGRWLNNRQRGLWSERIEHDHQGSIKLSAMIALSLESRVDLTAKAAGAQIEATAAEAAEVAVIAPDKPPDGA